MGVDGGGGYRYGCAPDLSKDKAAICDPGGGGLVLRLLPDENTVSMPARAVLYFVGLSWCFIGLSLVADIFMGAIEAITQRRKWNDTVANLTLMALGRSAPQILLSCIEIAGAGFYAGDLGPSTIVGSAAFNLLVTLAICMYVIPDGETRTIKRPAVFVVTAVGSVFANLWLVIIVGVSTPSLIEPWEGVCTFLFFPILVVLAYLADKGKTKECTANKGAAGNGAGVRVSISDKEAAGNGAGAGKLQLADNAVNFGVMTEGLAKWKSQFQDAICPVPPEAEGLSVGFENTEVSFLAGDAIVLKLTTSGEQASKYADADVVIKWSTSDGGYGLTSIELSSGMGQISLDCNSNATLTVELTEATAHPRWEGPMSMPSRTCRIKEEQKSVRVSICDEEGSANWSSQFYDAIRPVPPEEGHCDLFTRNPVLADRRRVAGQARAAVVGAAARPELKSRNHVAKLTGASAAWAVVLCRSISSVHAAHSSGRHGGLQRRRPWQFPLPHLRRFL